MQLTEFVELSRVDIAVNYIPVEVCQEIRKAMRNINARSIGTEFNLWDHGHENCFQILKFKFLETAEDLVKEKSNTVSKLELDRAWVNNYQDGEYIAPHHHGNSFVVAIAYIDVSEDSGDLLIQDPLTQYHWHNRIDKRKTGSTRASLAITPSTGMIVAMPGYLIHSSEPKPPGKNRFIVATNYNII
jgi:Putative 2OG-Fe(II) oxygenase